MKYLLFIYQPQGHDPKELTGDEYQAVAAQYAELNAMPNLKAGVPAGFPAKAVTVQVKDGQTISTPGPYTEIPVGGYCELEAASLEEAIRIAARIPAARLGGAVEVRVSERYW